MKYSGISFPSDFPQALIDNIRIQEEDQVLLKKYPLDYKGNDNYQNDQSHTAFANYMKNGNGNDNYANNSTIKQKSPLNCETNGNVSDRKRNNNLNNVIGRSQTNLRTNFSNNLPYSHQKNSAEGSINSNSINSDSVGYNNNRDRTYIGSNRKNSVISNFNNSKPILRARNTLSRASMKLKSFTALTDRRRSRAVLYNLNILSGKNESRNKNNLAKTWRSGINGGSNFQKQIPEYKMATMEHSVKYIIFHYSNIKILWDMLIMIATLYWGLGV